MNRRRVTSAYLQPTKAQELFQAAGEHCCGACGEFGEDREKGFAPTSYYLCERLHLLCRDCKQGWRVTQGNNSCPACRNETEYDFVITPAAESQEERN